MNKTINSNQNYQVVDIRPAKVNDWRKIKHINETCLPENYPDNMWIRELSQNNNNKIIKNNWVAVVKNNVVGYIVSNRGEGDPNINFNTTYVWSFAVKEKYRKNGIGRTLMKTLQNHSNTPVSLICRKSNSPAIHFYTKLGFKLKKVIDFYYSYPDESGVLFVYDKCIQKYSKINKK